MTFSKPTGLVNPFFEIFFDHSFGRSCPPRQSDFRVSRLANPHGHGADHHNAAALDVKTGFAFFFASEFRRSLGFFGDLADALIMLVLRRCRGRTQGRNMGRLRENLEEGGSRWSIRFAGGKAGFRTKAPNGASAAMPSVRLRVLGGLCGGCLSIETAHSGHVTRLLHPLFKTESCTRAVSSLVSPFDS